MMMMMKMAELDFFSSNQNSIIYKNNSTYIDKDIGIYFNQYSRFM